MASDLDPSGEVDCDVAPSRREGATLPEPQMHNLHNLHNEFGRKTSASADAASVYDVEPEEENLFGACMHFTVPEPGAESS